MNRIVFVLMGAIITMASFAQDSISANTVPAEPTPKDSCYVYQYLILAPTATNGYWPKLGTNEDGEFSEILNEKGENIRFKNLLHALNYMSASGWELVGTPSIDLTTSKDGVLVRKMMSQDDAIRYAAPSIEVPKSKKKKEKSSTKAGKKL